MPSTPPIDQAGQPIREHKHFSIGKSFAAGDG